MIQQGGAYVNEDRIGEIERRVGVGDLKEGGLLLKAGKKKVHRVLVE